ncbi:restin homolog [Sycon ciliatum]|uniref:restin homolog n=1 Tax=Sycon ciliatum TaxID=27933 RepID=UPI0031F63220
MSDTAVDADNAADNPAAQDEGEQANGQPTVDPRGELEKLKLTIEEKEGVEREEAEKRIQELEASLQQNEEKQSVHTQASRKSVHEDAEADAAGENSETAEGAADASANAPQADNKDEEKEAGEEQQTAADTAQDEDAPEKEVDLKLKKDDEPAAAATTTTEAAEQESESSATPATPATSSRKKSGRDSSRSMSRSESRVSTRSGKTPSRSGKGRKRQASTPDVLQDIPQLRRRGAPAGINQAVPEDEEMTSPIVSNPLERVVGPIFRRADVNDDKVLSLEEIFRVFRSPELGLNLSKEDLTVVKQSLGLNDESQLTFHQFIPLAQRILMRVYQQQDPDSLDEWIELMTSEGDMVWFNRFTGEASFQTPEGYTTEGGESNLIEDVIREIFAKADIDQTGYLSRDEFIRMLQSHELGLVLTESDIIQVESTFDINQDGKITFEEFVPLAKTLIMALYQRRDPSPGDWCRLSSKKAGLFWFNKRTGQSSRQPPAEVYTQARAEEEARQQNMLFVEQALSDLEGVQYELQAEREQREEVEYQLQEVAQEAEIARSHLEETGKRLDEANEKLNENEEVIESKEKTIDECQARITELEEEVSQMETIKSELQTTHDSLDESRAESSERATTINDRDAKVASLQEQIAKLTVELRSKTTVVQDQHATIEDLSERLEQEETRNRQLEEELLQMPVMEGELQKTETVLIQTQKHLDEKATALTVTRKNLRNVKDKNTELEQGLNIVSELRDKLHAARCEVHTLRQFVGGKTALVLQRERELDAVKQRMKEMEEKDSRRAQVLASVLEKTARLQQDSRSKTTAAGHMRSQSVGDDEGLATDRPLSCPALVPVSDDFDEEDYANTFDYPAQGPRTAATVSSTATRGLQTRGGTMQSMRSPSKLPPVSRVSRRPNTRAPPKHFAPVTPADVKARQHVGDAKFTGPMFPANLEPGRTLASIPISYALPEDDEAAADSVAEKQIKIGDRVLVRRKRMPWESESSKSSGIVRYVGRVDSEYVDNRIYVGVQLDTADGDNDGVVKGKRYFKCAQNRGILVRITEVLSVLPKKKLDYRPLIFNEMATSAIAT